MAAIKEAHKMDYIMETVGLRKAYKDNIVVDDEIGRASCRERVSSPV